MPFNQHPLALPVPPNGFDDTGLTGGKQAECIYGAFGDSNATMHKMDSALQQIKPVNGPRGITAFASGGMASCSAVLLRCETHAFTLGAVIHYDRKGDPGEILMKILGYYDLNNSLGLILCETYLATGIHDMSGELAYNSLTNAGLPEPRQYRHHGSACMDRAGQIFDQYA